jgi:hypothetical protein
MGTMAERFLQLVSWRTQPICRVVSAQRKIVVYHTHRYNT